MNMNKWSSIYFLWILGFISVGLTIPYILSVFGVKISLFGSFIGGNIIYGIVYFKVVETRKKGEGSDPYRWEQRKWGEE